jgi:hypothetical protein
MLNVMAQNNVAEVGDGNSRSSGLRFDIQYGMQPAQFSCCGRLLRQWRFLHSPLAWLLAISGMVHVMTANEY